MSSIERAKQLFDQHKWMLEYIAEEERQEKAQMLMQACYKKILKLN